MYQILVMPKNAGTAPVEFLFKSKLEAIAIQSKIHEALKDKSTVINIKDEYGHELNIPSDWAAYSLTVDLVQAQEMYLDKGIAVKDAQDKLQSDFRLHRLTAGQGNGNILNS